MTSVSKDVGSQTITNTYSYDDSDRLSTINHNGFDYTFTYDALGNNTKVNVGNQNLITRSFEARTSLLTDITYGNGQKMIYSYDDSDRVKGVSYDDGSASELRYEYEYDAAGNLGYHNDLENDVSYKYIYDLSNRLTKIKDSKGNVLTYGFDENNKVSEVNDLVNGTTYTTGFDFDKDSRVKVISYTRGTDTTESTSKLNYSYDLLGRVPSIVTDVDGIEIFESGFEFTKGLNGSSSVQLQSMTNTAGSNTGAYNEEELSYTYDSNGNILTITVVTKTEGQHDETKVIEYEYNELNEVVRENNEVLDKTMTYSYDLGGNILSKSEYAYTTESLGNPVDTIEYVYGDTNWKDKLTQITVDNNDKTLTYDAIGNLETFDGNTYTWEEGRRLKSIANANQSISYMYNAGGIRTSKTVDGVTTDYHLVGDKVTLETDGTNTIYYTYDASGKLISMNLTNTTYPSGAEFYYIRNAQGDITGLYDDTGKVVVEYSYDTWGKPESATDSDGITGELADTVGKINPYRYRGYRYDSETGMYYLQSRYYNPEIGRFINADTSITKYGGNLDMCNLFVYCSNNPVNMIDENGCWPRWITATVAVVAATVAIVATAPVALTVAVVATATLAIQTVHYDDREKRNEGVPSTKEGCKGTEGLIDLDIKDDLHQFSATDGNRNTKECWDNGKEAIYDSEGNLVIDPKDIGTYNYCVPKGGLSDVGHAIVDVLPYFIFGNNDDDWGPVLNTIIKWTEE